MSKKPKNIYKTFESTLLAITILLMVLWPLALLYKDKEFKQSTDPKDVYVTVVDKHIYKAYKSETYYIVVNDNNDEFKLKTKWTTYRKIETGQTLKLTVRYDKKTGEPVDRQKLKFAEQ